ncbi:MAG: hypothetical protein HY296_03225 [Thaumarchaeota archaeon]|nr:hypothetical protein [Nitrososphaerota archaeon]
MSRGDPAELRETRGSGGRVLVQTVKADAGRNEFFFEMLAAQTFAAMESGRLLARKPEVDLLLRIAGTNQITEAVERVGAKRGERYIAVFAGPRAGIGMFARALGSAGRRLSRNPLNAEELDRIERAALLNLSKY